MTQDDPLPSISVTLERIPTDDRIVIHGAYTDARQRRIGVLFLHGLGSNIFKTQPMWGTIAQKGQRHGIGILALQTRGHDIAASYRIKPKRGKRSARRYRMGGAGFERFGDSIFDIAAGVRRLQQLGYASIVLMGHSTGANKAIHYMAKKSGRRIGGVVLAGPARDLTANVAAAGSLAAHERILRQVQRFARKHGRDALLPEALRGTPLINAQRFLSLNSPGTIEDTFPYGEPKAAWTALGKITKPLYIVFGSEDPYLGEHTPEQIVSLMDEKAKRAKSVSADILPGQGHSFREDPEAFAESVTSWLKETLL